MGHAHASCVPRCRAGMADPRDPNSYRVRSYRLPRAAGRHGAGPRPPRAAGARARPSVVARAPRARARVPGDPRVTPYGPIDGQQLYKHSRIPRDWAERWTSRDDSDQPGQATPITIRLSAARVDLSCTECRGSERRPRAALVHERPATPLRTPSSRFCRKQDAAQDRSRPNRLRR